MSTPAASHTGTPPPPRRDSDRIDCFLGANRGTSATVHVGHPRRVESRSRSRWSATVAAVALLCVFAEVVVDALPDAPLTGLLTPLRVVIIVGLLGVASGWVSTTRAARAARLDELVHVGRHSHSAILRTVPSPPPALSMSILVLLIATFATVVVTGSGGPRWRALVTATAVGVLTWALARGGRHSIAYVAALAGLGTTSLVGVSQTINATPTGFCRASFFGELDECVPGAMVRADGTFANPNLLAAAVLLLLPLATAVVSRTCDGDHRLVGLAALVTGAAALLATGSRGGAAGLVVAAVVFAVLRRPTRMRVTAIVATALLVVIAGVVYVLAGGQAGPRGEAWRVAARLVTEHAEGVGLGASGERITENAASGPDFQHAHNLWVTWFVEAGVAGGVAALLVSVSIGVLVVGASLRGCTAARFHGAALAGFATLSLVDHPANADRLALLLAVVIGLAAAHAHCPSRHDPWEPTQPGPQYVE